MWTHPNYLFFFCVHDSIKYFGTITPPLVHPPRRLCPLCPPSVLPSPLVSSLTQWGICWINVTLLLFFFINTTQTNKLDCHMTCRLPIIFLLTQALTCSIIIILLMSRVLNVTYELRGWTAEMIRSLYGVFAPRYFFFCCHLHFACPALREKNKCVLSPGPGYMETVSFCCQSAHQGKCPPPPLPHTHAHTPPAPPTLSVEFPGSYLPALMWLYFRKEVTEEKKAFRSGNVCELQKEDNDCSENHFIER